MQDQLDLFLWILCFQQALIIDSDERGHLFYHELIKIRHGRRVSPSLSTSPISLITKIILLCYEVSK